MYSSRAGRLHSTIWISPLVVFAMMCVAAFLTRLMPMYISPYPFNNDSLVECGVAEEILSSRQLLFSSESPWYDTHSVVLPVFNVLLSFAAAYIGTEPLLVTQATVSSLSILTVGSIFILGRLISRSHLGAITSALGAVMLGTFVFTTASGWKETLGIALFVFSIICFCKRLHIQYRFLVIILLLLIVLTHHLVATVALLFYAYLLMWSWFRAISDSLVSIRHYLDTVSLVIPALFAYVYYNSPPFGASSFMSSSASLAILLIPFVVVSIIIVTVLSMRRHSRWTFSPLVATSLLVLLVLDYSGGVYPYAQSVSIWYVFLMASSVVLVGMFWYGSEVVIESNLVYRAVHLILILSPLTVLAYGISHGLTLESHKILYRSFDFIDISIFAGLGAGLVTIRKRHLKFYPTAGTLIVVCLIVSFPFAYATHSLLGVRHDTQEYEIDALEWIDIHATSPYVISDERISYIARTITWLSKDNSLPSLILRNVSMTPLWYCVIEEHWMTTGVNNYPYGTALIPKANYTFVTEAANVVYIGGPDGNRLTLFIGSYTGQSVIYPK